jgi:hypothetical protein
MEVGDDAAACSGALGEVLDCSGADCVDPDGLGVFDCEGAGTAGWDDCPAAPKAVNRIKSVGREKRMLEITEEKDLKLTTPKYKSEPTCSLTRLT